MYASVPDDSAGCGADDYIVYREPGGGYRRHEHDIELGDHRVDERERDAGDICVDIAERHDDDQPDGDDDVHADGNEHFRIGDGDGDGDGDAAEPADDQLVLGEPDGNRAGQREHAELDDIGRGEPLDQPGRDYADDGKRIDAGESGSDDHLCPDGDECCGQRDGVSDADGIDAEHTGDQLVLSEPDEHHNRREQHAELGDDGRDERGDRAGRVQLDIDNRIDDSKPDGNNDLYADGRQRGGHGDCDRGGDGHGDRRDADDYHDDVPRRHAEHSLRGLHNHSERRHAAVYLQREHGHELSAAARGNVDRPRDGCDHGRDYWRPGNV
jgi:hypothetical protein